MTSPSPECLREVIAAFDSNRAGAECHALVKELYPICRSITGNGVRKSLGTLRKVVGLDLTEVPTGTRVFDWEVPKEWNIRDAYIKDSSGERVVDFARSSLHVVNYSVPIRRRMRLAELREHLFSLPDTPDWIPYRTSYYRETWGFCLTHRQLSALKDDEDYEVCIDASLEPGHLTYGEFRIQGESNEEVLFSCHSCHPSLCNDNLSGMVVAALLARQLAPLALRYSYRFLWIPGTVGSITWLALHEEMLSQIRHGLVLSCLGDAGAFTYKRSRGGDVDIDRIVESALKDHAPQHRISDFVPYGYDERQYCSPGINLPVGCLMRTPNGGYPEYHTSGDNPDLVKPSALAESLRMLLRVVEMLELNRIYRNLNPRCEPQLGRRGLYRQMGGGKGSADAELAMLWVLNLSDGRHSLLDVKLRSGLAFSSVASAAESLVRHGLLEPVI